MKVHKETDISGNKKIKVCSSQYSYIFGGDQVHFPYSIATNVSYSIQFPEIKDNFHFEKVFLLRDFLEDNIEFARDADILLCSCYCWNIEITKKLAKSVKEINPKCLIVFGGPEVPDADRHNGTFFQNHPYVDIIVHGEGEVVLHNILKKYIEGGDFKEVNGIEMKDHLSPSQERMSNLDLIPSPWSTDLIWDLVDKDDKLKYVVSWETNRGCPYACSFCDWASSTKTKVRNFTEGKLYKEIEWFGKNNIVYVDCCDGNFGIFVDRDHRISEKLAETKSKTGFPEKIGLTWAKMSSEKILPMAKVLAKADLLRAVSLSVQSLDEPTLKIIKRTNIKFDKFENLIKTFDAEGIQTYTELIKGLPGETLTSFKNNWEILAGIYPPPTIMAWECSIFVNAPLNDEFYKKLHGVKAFSSPVFMSHTNVDKKGVPEFERMVCDVSSLGGKIKDVYLHNWTMMVFHSFGVLELIARYFNTKGVSYTKFYDVLGEFSRTSSLFGYEYKMAMDTAEKGYSGGGWEHFDPTLGSICWPVEEASWLRLTRDKQALKSEIERFLSFFVASNKEIEFNKDELEDLINFHIFTINSAQEIIETKHTSQYDWKKFFITREPLENKEITYVKSPLVVNKNPIEWGYESIWYGRRSQRYKIKLRDLKEVA